MNPIHDPEKLDRILEKLETVRGRKRKEYVLSLTEKDLLVTDRYRNIACELARRKALPREFMTPAVLRISEPQTGQTVAHILASKRILPPEFVQEVLSMRETDKREQTVANHMLRKLFAVDRWEELTVDLLNAPYSIKTMRGITETKDKPCWTIVVAKLSMMTSSSIVSQRRTEFREKQRDILRRIPKDSLLFIFRKTRSGILKPALGNIVTEDSLASAGESLNIGEEDSDMWNGPEDLYGAGRDI